MLIFDFDGVIVDSEPQLNALFCRLLAPLGVQLSLEQAMQRFTGVASAECVAGIERDFGLRLPATLGQDFYEQSLALYASGAMPLLPGLHELLAGLARPFCIASGSQRPKIAAGLRAHGLDALFGERFVSAHEVPRGKPHPDVYLEAARRFGADPADCLAVEDSPTGVQAARAAGMRVFGLVGQFDAATLVAAGAEPVARLDHLLARIPS